MARQLVRSLSDTISTLPWLLLCSDINNMFFQHQQQGFCFVPTSTTWLLFCYGINNSFWFIPMSTTWLSKLTTAVIDKERLRESSYARITSIKSQQCQKLMDWQDKTTIGLWSSKKSFCLTLRSGFAKGWWFHIFDETNFVFCTAVEVHIGVGGD